MEKVALEQRPEGCEGASRGVSYLRERAFEAAGTQVPQPRGECHWSVQGGRGGQCGSKRASQGKRGYTCD